MGVNDTFSLSDYPCLDMGITRRGPIYDVKTARSKSGRESRATWQLEPIYEFTIAINGLRQEGWRNRNSATDEVKKLMDFVNARSGVYDFFKIVDPVEISTTYRYVRFNGPIELRRIANLAYEAQKIDLIVVLGAA